MLIVGCAALGPRLESVLGKPFSPPSPLFSRCLRTHCGRGGAAGPTSIEAWCAVGLRPSFPLRCSRGGVVPSFAAGAARDSFCLVRSLSEQKNQLTVFWHLGAHELFHYMCARARDASVNWAVSGPRLYSGCTGSGSLRPPV